MRGGGYFLLLRLLQSPGIGQASQGDVSKGMMTVNGTGAIILVLD